MLLWLGSTMYRCVGSETKVGTENLPKFLLHVAVEQGRKVSSPGGGSRHLELTGGPPQTPHTWPKRSPLRDLGNLNVYTAAEMRSKFEEALKGKIKQVFWPRSGKTHIFSFL